MVDIHKAGLVGGALLGGWHVAWAGLVASGVAQTIYDYILWIHMIHLNITVGPFNSIAAASLVIVTSAVGYIIGLSGAWVWNKIHAQHT